MTIQKIRAALIGGHSIDMLSAIQLDNQISFDATEVDDERPDRTLAAKFRAVDLPIT
jgi:hypothetical protein